MIMNWTTLSRPSASQRVRLSVVMTSPAPDDGFVCGLRRRGVRPRTVRVAEG
jgi:hypothetical protein